MTRHSFWLPALLILAVCAPAGRPALAASGPAATVARYLAALRANDREALTSTFAPDYQYDGLDRTTATDVFDSFLGLRYRALHGRVEALVRTGDVVTATVGFFFEATVNLTALEGGQPLVNGTGRLVLELAPHGEEWLITGGRVVRAAYTAPGRTAARLFDFTVNDRTSLRVAPGATLTFAGKVFYADHLFLSIGESALNGALDPTAVTAWRAPLTAPTTPGRYLAHAVVVSRDLQVMERVAIPVIVVAP